MTLFRAEVNVAVSGREHLSDLGWGALVDTVVHSAPGNHFTLLDSPNLDAILEILK